MRVEPGLDCFKKEPFCFLDGFIKGELSPRGRLRKLPVFCFSQPTGIPFDHRCSRDLFHPRYTDN